MIRPDPLTPCDMKLQALALVCALSLACGCSRGSSGSSGNAAPQAEVETNDSPGTPQDLGTIAPGRSLKVRGEVTAFASDPFDVYRFEAARPTSVAVNLAPEGTAADLDAWWANESGEVIERFETAGSGPQSAMLDLTAGEVALLVVTAADVDAEYVLTMTGN